MADSLGMGQYLSKGGGYISEIDGITVKNEQVAKQILTDNSAQLNIQAVSADCSFETGTTYYLSFKISRHEAEDRYYNIKLVNQSDNSFQQIKRIKVPHGIAVGSSVPYEVISYDTPDEPFHRLMVYPIAYDNNGAVSLPEDVRPENGVVVASGVFSNGAEIEKTYLDIEAVFSPNSTAYSKIVIEPELSYNDYIKTYGLDGEQYSGVAFDVDEFSVSTIRNIIKDDLNKTSLTRIGVWGHSDMLMAINGEEHRISPVEYYEFYSNKVNITSFGVITKTPYDRFVVDYQYVK